MEEMEYEESKKGFEYEKKLRKHGLCLIDQCKHFDNCDRIQINGENVKCINYESPFKSGW